MKNKHLKWKSSFTLLLAIAIGCILGIFFKDQVKVLKPLGDIFINLMFMMVVPLVFFLITTSITKLGSSKQFGKIIKTTLMIFLMTSFLSSLFMMGSLSLIKPKVENVIPTTETEITEINIGDKIVETITVKDFPELLSKSHLLPLMIFASLFGFGILKSKEKGAPLKALLESGTEALLKMIDIIMYYAPIGICAYFANLIAEMGPELIGSYAAYFIVYLIACLIYFLLFYSFYAFLTNGKTGVKTFWKHISASTFTSLATCSSIGTLPVNMETTKKMGIKENISSVTLSLGAATHMEGSSMGTVLKIMFLFAVFGRNFYTLPNILITLIFATFICTAMSGIPSGGLISEILILSIFQFPTTAYPLLTTIAWLIDAPATCLNATGDIPATMIIQRLLEKPKKA